MQITERALWTLIHGMAFGGLYLLACSGALVWLYQFTDSSISDDFTRGHERFVRIYLIAMVVLAWAAVLSGTYVIYPWYRAAPLTGRADLSMFPQRLLMSRPATSGWHSLGMEWKEHVAWFAPISITMVAFVFIRYGHDLRNHRQLRSAVLVFALASLVASGIAGFFGAEIDDYAPVRGGSTIHLSHAEAK
ncbi:MAG: hypothetical protein JO097_00595 [Acidobacteriaceae bacterium]|nr:hypothetical protein [Acidobacteriaceae bacterium]MBV9296863.1 hypothetical protein [Acidobacteriaceae bacterium]MBV9765716.1 hypothetical protein [Acidobacteriaceae bacterium]